MSRGGVWTFVCAAAAWLACGPARAQEAGGAHDFDFELGAWKTHVSRLLRPLSAEAAWAEYDGTSVVRPLLGGRANVVELDVAGPKGRIEGLSLRLYNPAARQWSLNFVSRASGIPSPPTVGAFKDGRGEFYDQETYEGRAILVRFVISAITPTSARFEQAFSADGGRTWEVNWIATDTRMEAEPKAPPAAPADAPHDFDFYVGSWKLRHRRLQDPLSGSTTWYAFEGRGTARRLWDGAANLDEIEADTPQGPVQGLTLSLFDARARQWRLYWVSAAGGVMGVPIVGAFKDGRAALYDQETFDGRTILVRNVWSGLSASAYHWEQAFSADGGTTWETNWVTDATRLP